MNACHLHVHCEKSWFDSIMKVQHIIKKAEYNRMSSVALTDHHHVMGWVELERCSDTSSVKPIFGIELNVMSYHITALAMNEKGIENIIKLNNLGHHKNKIALSEKELYEHKEGIYFLTGCSKGKLFTEYYKNGIQGIKKTIDQFDNMFKGYVGIEMTNPKLYHDVLNLLIGLSTLKGMPIVPTNDCHFLEKEDGQVYSQNLWLRTRGKITTHSHDRYFKTSEEMSSLYKKEWIQNTMEVAAKCDASFRHYCQDVKDHTYKIPLSKIERYSDEESMKIIYLSKKEYKKANTIFSKMRKLSLTLEDLLFEEEYMEEVAMAFGIRNMIKQIKEDKDNEIVINLDKYPIMKNRKTGKIFSQWTAEEAEHLGIDVFTKKITI